MGISSVSAKKYAREGRFMIVMNIEVNNFFAFKNFKMNMSYPKKVVGSYIEEEHLQDRENFRYKKVNILMGANATGKTSIARMLQMVFNFILKKESANLFTRIYDNNECASFSMDFVVNSKQLYRLNIEIDTESQLRCMTRVATINKKDSYETCVKKIEKVPLNMNSNIEEELKKIEGIGWAFAYPSTGDLVSCSNDPKYPLILDYTLRALDPSIIRVDKLDEVENSYVVKMKYRDLIIQDGEVIKENILSSGTKEGIGIASIISAICSGAYGFYYCDEKFSFVHSDVEKAFLSLMINKLEKNQQLFFTTHNLDILDLPLPKHSFTLLKKDIYDSEQPIKCVNVSKYLKRNTDSVRNAVENDLFSTAPNLNLIYQIVDL